MCRPRDKSMFKFLEKWATQNNAKRYSEFGLRMFRVDLFADLKSEYTKSLDAETAGILSAQVVNYLVGEDIDDVLEHAIDPLKSKIVGIRDQIEEHALTKLNSDPIVRRLVVYTLRIRVVLQFGLIGEEYLLSPEKQRIEKILSQYGAEFPEEASLEMYETLVWNYHQNHLATDTRV